MYIIEGINLEIYNRGIYRVKSVFTLTDIYEKSEAITIDSI